MITQIPGAKIINMGANGAGKSHALRTVPLDKFEVFSIFTEPNSLLVLGEDWLNNPRVHWRYLGPTISGWDMLKLRAKEISTLPNEALAKGNGNKSKYPQFMNILDLCNNFIDQRGESFGDIADWGTNRLTSLDSLTGLVKMIRQLVAGHKTTLTLPEYGIVQHTIETFLDKITTTCACHFILTAHMEYNKDEILGGYKLMLRSFGNKLSPVLATNFNDFILSYAEGSHFYWSTSDSRCDLKTNNLTLGATKLPQNYAILLEKWVKQGGIIAPRAEIDQSLKGTTT